MWESPARACPPGGATSPEGTFPEDAPHDFQMAVVACRDLSIAAGSDPNPSLQRVFTFTIPEGSQVLRVEAAWKEADRKRALATGLGTCPPCESKDRAKGRGSVRLEVPVPDDAAGHPWFVSLSCDPAEDDLEIDTPTLHVRVCDIASEGSARGLFPPAGLDLGSRSVLEHDAFGMEGFDGVRTATYQGGKLLAFVTATGSPEEAQARATAYREYLVSLGGEEVAVEGPRGATGVRTFGLTTVIFTRGAFVAGVQEAAYLDLAVALAGQLADWLSEA
ncbi:MAG: hypothetical protein ABIO70_00320 [Pseudomonadota bacterium]